MVQKTNFYGNRGTTSMNGLTKNDAGGLLNSDMPIDYVAHWDAEKQEQHGAARGDLSKNLYNTTLVTTGNFNLENGYPYFISATYDFDRWTYVGKLPEHVTFEFKYVSPTQRTNYIVLPLDTSIATAKDLCNATADDGSSLMSNDDSIGLWDVEEQKIITPAPSCYDIKNVPGNNFNLEAGKVYLITVPSDKTWTQR